MRMLEQAREYCWLQSGADTVILHYGDGASTAVPATHDCRITCASAEGMCCSAGVDTSAPALDLARCNAEANGLVEDRCTFQQADVMDVMKAALAERRQYDIVVLDPPKLAPNRKSLQRAAHR